VKGVRSVIPYSDPYFGRNLSLFPSLKHLFKCEETSGTILRCSKSGLIWTPAELAFDSTLGTVQPNHTTRDTYGITNQAFESFGSSYILHVCVLRAVAVAEPAVLVGFILIL
jgi:hypothetical protein